MNRMLTDRERKKGLGLLRTVCPYQGSARTFAVACLETLGRLPYCNGGSRADIVPFLDTALNICLSRSLDPDSASKLISCTFLADISGQTSV